MNINMNNFFWVALIISTINSGNGFILVPSEIPLLLQLFYTKIPPIRTGTDSKVGFGFRVGKNADVQVLFEIGPQENLVADNSKRSALKYKY